MTPHGEGGAKSHESQARKQDLIELATYNLLRYCRSEGWIGYDPYDGLNSFLSRLFPSGPKLARQALTQLVKRSPINLRPALGIRKAANAKGIALAARAVALLAAANRAVLPVRIEAAREDSGAGASSKANASFAASLVGDFTFLMARLGKLRSTGYAEACWGYNFDWQSRAFFAPRGTPNTVCTVFAAHALLDWEEKTGSEQALDAAISSGRFILDRINRSPAEPGFCFSYTPLDSSRVHNVNMLGAELLARLYARTRVEEYRATAELAASYTIAMQRGDGSWPYGEGESQSWIDSFHTGFVLVSLKRIIEWLGIERWRPQLAGGYKFYGERFFLADSTPGYYHDQLYPVDVHSAAQAVITFLEMADQFPGAAQKATSALKWSIHNLQDPSGFFYFQRRRLYTNKIPYMRWGQAWMLYALSFYLSKGLTPDDN